MITAATTVHPFARIIVTREGSRNGVRILIDTGGDAAEILLDRADAEAIGKAISMEAACLRVTT